MTQAKSASEKMKVGSVSVGALAVGAVAIGAVAIGAVAVGVMTVRRLNILKGRIERLSLGTLTVDHLSVFSNDLVVQPRSTRKALLLEVRS